MRCAFAPRQTSKVRSQQVGLPISLKTNITSAGLEPTRWPLAPCLIGMEACATAHYLGRELTKLGHEARLMPAKDVKAYVKRKKNDVAATDPGDQCHHSRLRVRSQPILP